MPARLLLEYQHPQRTRRLPWWMVTNACIVSLLCLGLVAVAGHRLRKGDSTTAASLFAIAAILAALEFQSLRAPGSPVHYLATILCAVLALPALIIVIVVPATYAGPIETGGFLAVLAVGVTTTFLLVTHLAWIKVGGRRG